MRRNLLAVGAGAVVLALAAILWLRHRPVVPTGPAEAPVREWTPLAHAPQVEVLNATEVEKLARSAAAV